MQYNTSNEFANSLLLFIEISSIKWFLNKKKSHCVVLFEIKGQNKLMFFKAQITVLYGTLKCRFTIAIRS